MRKVMLVLSLAFILILPAIARADLNYGLVAYYSFNNCDATDDSGNGNNGTIHGNPPCGNGIIGKAFEFGKEGNYISVDKSRLTDLAINDFSVNAWIMLKSYYSPESNSTHGIIIRKMYGGSACGGGYEWDIAYDKKNYDVKIALAIPQCNPYNYNQKYISLGKLSLNKWYMVTSVYIKGSKVKTYLNGNFIGEQDYSNVQGAINNTINLQIGQKPDDWTYKDLFPGIIDELRIYNRALSESEIKQLYEQGINGGGSTCSGGGYTEADLQKKYQEGIEEGKKICKQNPSACGITVSSTTDCSSEYQSGYNNGYNKGYEDGKNSCSGSGGGENPFLPPTTSSQCATFDFFTNKFHVPCFQGTNATYWLDFKLINQNPVQLEMTKFGKNK